MRRPRAVIGLTLFARAVSKAGAGGGARYSFSQRATAQRERAFSCATAVKRATSSW